MNFNVKNRFANAEDSLLIFLFIKIVNNSLQIEDFDKEYSQFRLTDKIVDMYNIWIKTGCKNKEFIENWLEHNHSIKDHFYKNFTLTYQPKAVIWSDREKNDYYINMLQKAHEFECFLENVFMNNYNLDLGIYDDQNGQYNKGECELGIEIKFDMMSVKTGNLYIEYAEKADANNEEYISSGILKNDDSSYFLIGDRNNFFIFPKNILLKIYKKELRLYNENIPDIEREVIFIKKPTSLGFIINIQTALKYTISIDNLIKKLKN